MLKPVFVGEKCSPYCSYNSSNAREKICRAYEGKSHELEVLKFEKSLLFDRCAQCIEEFGEDSQNNNPAG